MSDIHQQIADTVPAIQRGKVWCRQYTCSECGGTFKSERSDDEARAEMHENFPGVPFSEMAVICDDCYRAFMEWYRQVQP